MCSSCRAMLMAAAQVADELGVAVTPKELAGMVAEFDTNRDGRIDLAEFRALLALAEGQDDD